MTLPFGSLGPDAIHLCIDMQRMFAEAGDWHTPALHAILPAVEKLARHCPGRTIFTRFTVPRTAEEATGVWRRYYRRWSAYTGERLDPALIGLAGNLPALCPPEGIFDKPGHSAFGVSGLHERLQARGVSAVIVSGVETDVCVLATVLQAVDLGYRVVVTRDAVASSSDAGHAATLDHVLGRYDQQIEVAGTADILACWA